MKSIFDATREQVVLDPSTLSDSSDSRDSSDTDDNSADEGFEVDKPLKGTINKDEHPEPLYIESESLYPSIKCSIECLHLSYLETYSREGKFAKSSAAKSYSTDPETDLIRNSYPLVAENSFLLNKLGRANAQRRQWIWYNQRQNQNLSAVESVRKRLVPIVSLQNPKEVSDVAPLTFLSNTNSNDTNNGDGASPDTASHKSTKATKTKGQVPVPAVPSTLVYGEPHQCPYCCKTVKIVSSDAWQ